MGRNQTLAATRRNGWNAAARVSNLGTVVRTKPLVLAALTALLPACSADPRTQAKNVADAYVRHFGEDRLLQRSVTVADDGSRWAVTYNLPEGYAGGDCVVWVDKRTMEVGAHMCGQ